MFHTYKILTALIFIYAIAHLVYPLFDDSGLTSAEQVMWFLSGGLAVFFSGFINLINLTLRSTFARRVSIVANATMLVFMIMLCIVVGETQVFVLAFILLMTLTVSSITSPINARDKRENLEIK